MRRIGVLDVIEPEPAESETRTTRVLGSGRWEHTPFGTVPAQTYWNDLELAESLPDISDARSPTSGQTKGVVG